MFHHKKYSKYFLFQALNVELHERLILGHIKLVFVYYGMQGSRQ